MTARVYAFANQKGGVGKTTSCVNLAASLVYYQQRVLMIDLDPQGNATMGSGVDKGSLELSMNELLQGEADINEVIIRQTPAGYDLLPANSDLTAANVVLLKRDNAQFRLADEISKVTHDYDYILLDCPPSLSMLTLNGLVAADAVIIAMQCEYFALEGLSDLLTTVRELQENVNEKLGVFGIIRTMFDPRNRLSIEVSSQLIEHFGNKVFQTVIPRNIRLAEAPSYGLPVYLYDKNSRGSAAYLALASELLRRVKSEQAQHAQQEEASV